MSILEIADRIHDGKKQRNKNLLQDKVIDAIVDKNSYSLEKIKEETGLGDKDIDSVIDNLEQDELISCLRGGSSDRVISFEMLKALK